MKTNIYIDENFAIQLAEGLNIFQQHLNLKDKNEFDVLSIKKEFGQGARDEEWLPKIGQNNGVVITQDLSIQTTRHQRDLYNEYDVGVFFFKPPSKGGFTFWEMVQHLVKRFESIKNKTIKTERPFAYRCTSKKDFEPLD